MTVVSTFLFPMFSCSAFTRSVQKPCPAGYVLDGLQYLYISKQAHVGFKFLHDNRILGSVWKEMEREELSAREIMGRTSVTDNS